MSLKYPVVFVHGFIVTGRCYDWAGLDNYMDRREIDFTIYERPSGLGVKQRGERLAEWLSKTYGNEPVHLIGHSAGGMDIRYCASKFKNPIASAITMATPHHGTPYAQYFLYLPEECPAVEGLFDLLNDPEDLIREFTPAAMNEFNKVIHDREGLYYGSLSYYIDSIWKDLSSYKGWSYLRDAGYPLNDGTIPLLYQKWGRDIGDVSGIHGQVNIGAHKSESLPFFYGFRRIWEKQFDKCLDKITEIELNG